MLDNITLKNELWKEIPGYEGLYQVSNLGRVWSIKRQRILIPQPTYNGYNRVGLFAKNGKLKNERVGRLVALTFIPNPEGLPQVDHINSCRTDDRVENLRWVSSKENNRHRCNNTVIEQYTLDGTYITTYGSVAEANEAIGKKPANSAIYDALRRKTGYSAGYIWKRAK